MANRIEVAVAELVDALRAELTPPDPSPPRLLSIQEASRAMGVGRSLLYTELAAGRLRSVKVGNRRLIPTTAIAEYAGQNSEAASAAA